ncbi:hypothetical protein KSS87_010191 [Heliosperma pusillum]|nr:hypothetical protein KSS87_010191 [Heliosperma pusillum]
MSKMNIRSLILVLAMLMMSLNSSTSKAEYGICVGQQPELDCFMENCYHEYRNDRIQFFGSRSWWSKNRCGFAKLVYRLLLQA